MRVKKSTVQHSTPESFEGRKPSRLAYDVPPAPPQELAMHGMTPKHPSFDAALKNSADLYERFQATGDVEDRRRLEAANATVVDLHVSDTVRHSGVFVASLRS